METYYDAAAKANYAAVWSVQYGTEEQQQMLKECIREHTGAKEVVFGFHIDSGDDWSYIDHQSSDVAAEAFESKETK